MQQFSINLQSRSAAKNLQETSWRHTTSKPKDTWRGIRKLSNESCRRPDKMCRLSGEPLMISKMDVYTTTSCHGPVSSGSLPVQKQLGLSRDEFVQEIEDDDLVTGFTSMLYTLFNKAPSFTLSQVLLSQKNHMMDPSRGCLYRLDSTVYSPFSHCGKGRDNKTSVYSTLRAKNNIIRRGRPPRTSASACDSTKTIISSHRPRPPLPRTAASLWRAEAGRWPPQSPSVFPWSPRGCCCGYCGPRSSHRPGVPYETQTAQGGQEGQEGISRQGQGQGCRRVYRTKESIQHNG